MNKISSEKVEYKRAKIKDPENKYKINKNNKTMEGELTLSGEHTV